MACFSKDCHWFKVHGDCFYDGVPPSNSPSTCEECRFFKAPTNYDLLLRKTPEELARWIDEFWSAAWCPDDPPIDPETKRCLLHDGDCRLCILDWLRQEVSDAER